MMTEPEELVKKIVAGDAEAFRNLIAAYQRLVCHIVFRMVNNEADREDLCQEVFVKVYQNLSSFHFESKLSTWIAKIAYNASINYLKKKKLPLFADLAGESESLEKSFSSHDATDSGALATDLTARLQKEIETLPVQYRTILTLYHLEEMSYAEISEILEMPDGTVKSYLFRARKLLKERLSAKYQVEELWP
jgi:RNA polymerase sigma-70 factor (ECF subfamily)